MKAYKKPEVKKENSKKSELVEQYTECRCSGCTTHYPEK